MPAIQLPHGRIAYVSLEDYEWLLQWQWRVVRSRYMYHALRADGIRMHQDVIQRQGIDASQMMIRHKDGDGLNNQRENLQVFHRGRVCETGTRIVIPPRGEPKKYKGVIYSGGTYNAVVPFCGHLIHIGQYSTAFEAARAYDKAVIYYHGNQVQLNGV